MPIDAPTFEELYNRGKAELNLRQPTLLIRDGDVSDVVGLSAPAAMADAAVGYTMKRFAGLSLDTASGDDLSVLADDRTNGQVTRLFANAATVIVTLTRLTLTAGAGQIDAGTVLATEPDGLGQDIQFSVLEDVAVGSGTYSVDVTLRAVNPGVKGNVAATTITRIVSPVFDASFTVSQPDQAAGGTEDEQDPVLRKRVRDWALALGRGTKRALEFGALLVPGVAYATCLDTTLGATVYIADASGGSSAPLVAAVVAELENWRATGVVTQVVGAFTVYLSPVVIVLTLRQGIAASALADDIKLAVVARLERLAIGENAALAYIQNAIFNVDPENILNADVTVALPFNNPAQLVRVHAGAISVS